MTDDPRSKHPEKPQHPEDEFTESVGRKEQSRIRAAKRRRAESVWFGLGTFGIVGWSVTVPAVIMIFIGIWIDVRYASRYSWTLMFLVAGIGLGALNAWLWVERQRDRIRREREDDYD